MPVGIDMFEKSFRRLAAFTSRHSTAVIILWVVALVLVAPFASLFLSNTSYDLSGSIVPANSQAKIASDLQTQYFPSTAGPGSNGTSLAIITHNTNTTTAQGASGLLSLQASLVKYFKTVKGYNNISTVFTTENSTLQSYATGLKEELNGTYSLVSGINGNLTTLNKTITTQTNESVGLLYGLEKVYYDTLIQSSYQTNSNANYTAYEYAVNAAISTGNKLAPIYVNSTAKYFNATYQQTQAPSQIVTNLNTSIHETLLKSEFQVIMDSNPSTSSAIKELYLPLTANYTFSNYLSNESYSPFVKNYTITQISNGLANNSQAMSLINSTLNLTARDFTTTVYNAGLPSTGAMMTQISINMVTNATKHQLTGSPLLTYNPNHLRGFIQNLNGTTNVSDYVTNEIMNKGSFATYPIVPTPYLYHQFVGYNNRTTIILVSFSENYSLAVVDHATNISEGYNTTGKLPGSAYYVSGGNVVAQQLNTEITAGMIKALGIGIALSVLIVGLFFRSPVAAFIPLGMFGFSTVMAMGINGLLYTYVFHATISFVTPTLLLILILGLTSDYVVYIMSRFRQEKRRQNPDAILDAGQWAGHAVFTSGITVALSYIVLWLSNIPLFSDSGLTNAIGVGISITLANTFLIALLHKAGTRVFWPSKVVDAGHFPMEKSMIRLSHFARDNKKKILVVFLVVSFAASYIYFITPTSMDVFDLVPPSSGVQALEVANSSFHGDYFNRGYLIMNFTSPLEVNGVYNATEMSQITAVEMALDNQSEISLVYGPTFPYGYYVPQNLTGIPSTYHSEYRNTTNSFIAKSNPKVATITFQLASVSWRGHASTFVANMHPIIDKALSGSSASTSSDVAHYFVGGLTESLNNAHSYTQATFVKIVPILLIAIFAILLMQLSSVFTPLRLIFMVLSAVIIALSIVFLIVFYGQGQPLLIYLPLFTFITLLAVGLDYDIFMVSRVREEVMKGRPNEEAVMTSMKENGGVIITLGMLLFVTFGALYLSGIGIMQEIGLGLALGVIIDTFVSWPFFVPVIMMLMKRLNWWPSRIESREEFKP